MMQRKKHNVFHPTLSRINALRQLTVSMHLDSDGEYPEMKAGEDIGYIICDANAGEIGSIGIRKLEQVKVVAGKNGLSQPKLQVIVKDPLLRHIEVLFDKPLNACEQIVEVGWPWADDSEIGQPFYIDILLTGQEAGAERVRDFRRIEVKSNISTLSIPQTRWSRQQFIDAGLRGDVLVYSKFKDVVYDLPIEELLEVSISSIVRVYIHERLYDIMDSKRERALPIVTYELGNMLFNLLVILASKERESIERSKGNGESVGHIVSALSEYFGEDIDKMLAGVEEEPSRYNSLVMSYAGVYDLI